MPEITKENKHNFEEKLKFIGLDLDNIPEFLKDFSPLDFRPTKRFDNKEYLVYRYIPIQNIQILITKSNRLTNIKEKYDLAKPISEYLKAETEEEIENFATFLNMLKNTDIKEIEEVEQKQKNLSNGIPYKVRYEKNYLWQIYYSEYTDRYFMLVPSEEAEFGCFFYLLKEQIKNYNTNCQGNYIYVPVANIEPSESILKRSERADLENYLWLFTKNWPNIYEIIEKDNSYKIVIIGEVEVYTSVMATYHIELTSREIASEFYKELKALFILQTELSSYYTFNVQIDANGNLQFYYGSKKINYTELMDFIKNEYLTTKLNMQKATKEFNKLSIRLEELKTVAEQKEKEFIEKQREITTYLQYKKTFFGRVKYFFTRKKTNKKREIKIEATITPVEEITNKNFDDKTVYTIEDLVVIYDSYTKTIESIKNKKLDVDALELKIKNLTKKIENATLYINEIDKHKKSIFDFWKFSSKDDMLSLNSGEEVDDPNVVKTLRRVFNYNTDREDITKEIDKLQRENLSKEQEDSIFVANSQILPTLNKIKTLVKISDEKIEELLQGLKSEIQKNEQYVDYEYDIFGSISEDRTKIKVLGSNKHRETEKNKLQILEINKETTLQDFKEKLKEIEINLRASFNKSKNVIDMPIYKAVSEEEKIDLYGYSIYSMSAEDQLKKMKTNGNECNLFKINLQEEMPAIFYTNIIFFDNFNKTLPLGMDKSDNVMLNSDSFEFILKDKKTVYTNQYFTEDIDSHIFVTKKINVYEYDLKVKEIGGKK